MQVAVAVLSVCEATDDPHTESHLLRHFLLSLDSRFYHNATFLILLLILHAPFGTFRREPSVESAGPTEQASSYFVIAEKVVCCGWLNSHGHDC